MSQHRIDPDMAPVAAMVSAARPVFAGRQPHHVGAALADLVATWLAGHPAELREDLLAMHIEYVRMLIFINAAEIEERS